MPESPPINIFTWFICINSSFSFYFFFISILSFNSFFRSVFYFCNALLPFSIRFIQSVQANRFFFFVTFFFLVRHAFYDSKETMKIKKKKKIEKKMHGLFSQQCTRSISNENWCDTATMKDWLLVFILVVFIFIFHSKTTNLLLCNFWLWLILVFIFIFFFFVLSSYSFPVCAKKIFITGLKWMANRKCWSMIRIYVEKKTRNILVNSFHQC